jgi:CspA family cold shock protein
MSQGTVKFFVDQKGFGFITPDDGSPDIFVHRTGITGTDRYRMLEKGQVVEFEITQGEKGPQATNVKPMP